ncbi:uncharacterized protein LOC117787540 [Drosophila innubila]|uniref:uncharacterized protein LOC117787540 n=1 Tax=Drosophila innubila TaxID=198719 RepID=UPI00148D1760|nr:uncharacterized protein LOC117787540 [Drosophila innubila]
MTTKIVNALQVVGLLSLSCLVNWTFSDCNVCQPNQAACINSTSYYMCFGDDTPYTDHIYNCLAGFQCSDYPSICIQKNAQRPPSCGDTSKCGHCSAHRNYKFACHSRGIFQLCYGASQPTGSYGKCPAGTVCDASSDVVCVQEKPGQAVTCDVNDDLVGTTTEDPTGSPTSSPTTSPVTDPASQTAQEICKLRAKSGLYETVPRDPYCKRYIDCYYNKDKVIAVEYGCSETSYFEADTQRCTYIKPSNCI